MTETETAKIGGYTCTWKKWPAYTGAKEFRQLAHLIGKDVLGSLLGGEDPELDMLADGEFNTVAALLMNIIDSACGEGKVKRKLELLSENPGMLPEQVDALIDPLYPHNGFEEWALHWITLAGVDVEGHAIRDAQTADDSPLGAFDLLALGWEVFRREAGPLFDRLASFLESRREAAKTTPDSSSSAATG